LQTKSNFASLNINVNTANKISTDLKYKHLMYVYKKLSLLHATKRSRKV
jgi:hypothetical protein